MSRRQPPFIAAIFCRRQRYCFEMFCCHFAICHAQVVVIALLTLRKARSVTLSPCHAPMSPSAEAARRRRSTPCRDASANERARHARLLSPSTLRAPMRDDMRYAAGDAARRRRLLPSTSERDAIRRFIADTLRDAQWRYGCYARAI